MTDDENDEIGDAIIQLRRAIGEAVMTTGNRILENSELTPQQILFIAHVALRTFAEDFRLISQKEVPGDMFVLFEDALRQDLDVWRRKHLS
jgi:hypothetical protein